MAFYGILWHSMANEMCYHSLKAQEAPLPHLIQLLQLLQALSQCARFRSKASIWALQHADGATSIPQPQKKGPGMTSKWHPNDIQMTSKWHPMTSMTLSLYGSLWRKWSKLVNCRCLDNVLSTCAIQASYSSYSTCQKALYGLVTCISATKSIVLAARFQNQDFASRTP